MNPIGVDLFGRRETIEVFADREYSYTELILFDGNQLTNCSFLSVEKITVVKTRSGSYSPFSNCKFGTQLNIHVISKEDATIFLNDIHIQNIQTAFIGACKIYLDSGFYLVNNYVAPCEKEIFVQLGDEMEPVIERFTKKFHLNEEFFSVYAGPDLPSHFIVPFVFELYCRDLVRGNPENRYLLARIKVLDMHVHTDPLLLAIIEQRNQYNFSFEGDVQANWSVQQPGVILEILERFERIEIKGDINKKGFAKVKLSCGNLVVSGSIGDFAFHPESRIGHIHVHHLQPCSLIGLYFREADESTIIVEHTEENAFDGTSGYLKSLTVGHELDAEIPSTLKIGTLSLNFIAEGISELCAETICVPLSSLTSRIKSAIKIVIDRIDEEPVCVPSETLVVEIKNMEGQKQICRGGMFSTLNEKLYFRFLSDIEFTNEELEEYLEEFKLFCPEGATIHLRHLVGKDVSINVLSEGRRYPIGWIKIREKNWKELLEKRLEGFLPYAFGISTCFWGMLMYLSFRTLF